MRQKAKPSQRQIKRKEPRIWDAATIKTIGIYDGVPNLDNMIPLDPSHCYQHGREKQQTKGPSRW